MSFIQLHLLRTLPFSNPNRDDAGRPKSGVLGGVDRLRISSQSIKRALRDSACFATTLNQEGRAHRTRTIPSKIVAALQEAGVPNETIEVVIIDIVGVFMTLDKRDDKTQKGEAGLEEWLSTVKSSELVFMSDEEVDRLAKFCLEVATTKDFAETKPKKSKKAAATSDEGGEESGGKSFGIPAKEVIDRVLDSDTVSAEISLFGRMLAKVAANTDRNVDGALQVGHAVTTHRAVAEEDYFTAMDDLNSNGAGLIQSQAFGSGTYYSYFAIDVETLVENLGGDVEAAKRLVGSFIEAAMTVLPGGKRTSFGHNTLPFYARLEADARINRQLGDAFTAPVTGDDLQAASVDRLEEVIRRQETFMGPIATKVVTANLLSDESETSLQDIVEAARAAAVAGGV